MISDYRELRVWQDAMALAESIYAMTRQLPVDERFGLTAQLRRAVVSIASCIAEGNARSSTRDYLRFLSMSAGSLAEVETQTLLAERLGYVSSSDAAALLNAMHSLARQLQTLRKALSNKLATNSSLFPVPRSPL
ncbi:four helix bundle protein [Dyella tabacisoli]|uniref:four helix bundle protein n=1 Tax=Dyella tabacisoli TaxID=2282381 RepID=UPI001CDCF566|nr:four helix bundle protein [Dyella tabacisoli]